MKTIKIPNLKEVFNRLAGLKVEAKPETRYEPEDEICPICTMGMPIIYDQEHDACITCKSIWKIRGDKKAQ